jgi:hypothetical protein
VLSCFVSSIVDYVYTKQYKLIKERHALYSSPNTRWFKYDRDDLCVNKSQFVPVIFEPPCIIRVTKSRILRWARHVARMAERGGA